MSETQPGDVTADGIKVNQYGHALQVDQNWDSPIERGYEYMIQDLRESWLKKERERRGLSRQQIHELTGFEDLFEPEQELIEDYGQQPDVNQIFWYGRIFGLTPGQVLDEMFSSVGRELIEEEKRDRGEVA
jgi:hypothetical protein